MTKFVKIVGFLLGAAMALHGCALAIAGNRFLPTTTRGGSQHYWNALVGVFGERGASLVSGGAWFALGIVVIYFILAPTEKGLKTQRKPRRGRSGRA
jgi:hypothetical protein